MLRALGSKGMSEMLFPRWYDNSHLNGVAVLEVAELGEDMFKSWRFDTPAGRE